MDTNLLITVLTSFVTICTTILTVRSGNDKVMTELEKHNLVQDERISNLTKQVEKHNNVVERMYRLEEKVETIEKSLEKNQEV